MTTNKLLLLFITIFLNNMVSSASSDERISRTQYIDTWKEEAINQMIKHGIPASITLAQGILESGDGNSKLAQQGNNHFGIKCHNWDGKTIHKDDDNKNDCFRKYNNAKESFEDHSDFLTKGSRYSFLFDLKPTDYKGWAKGLKTAGYATNSKYADLLIALIEKNNLQQYDNAILASANSTQAISYNAINGLSVPKTNKHSVYTHDNNIKYIKVQSGDTFYKISKEFGIHLGQLYKYNDFSESNFIEPGDFIYLQPKRKKAKKETHVVKKGETLQVISQTHGIKLKSLCKKNQLEIDTVLKEGQKLSLR